jgi:GDPmannose 4,6-dehydratase
MNKMLTRKQPEDFLIATGKQTPLHEFVSKTFEAVGLPWQKYVFYDDQFVRSNDCCHPLAAVKETTDVLGWTATVQLPELIQNMISAYQKNDETNHLTF